MRTVKENKEGSILVTTLWIMAILTLLAMGIGFRASLEVRLSKYNMDKLQARYLAKAGIEKAKELLSKDIYEYDTLYECGISLNKVEEETPETIFGAEYNEVGEGSFSVHYDREKEDEEEPGTVRRYGMIDEERKINLNMSKLLPDSEIVFRNILKVLSPDIDNDIIDAILDWQGKGPGLTAHYYSLQDHPYKCKRTDFEYVEELLLVLVKDIKKELYNEIKDCVTVYGKGKINVNTVSEKVLNAVVGGVIGENSTLVASIISERKNIGRVGGASEGGWDNIGEFLVFLNATEMISSTNAANLSNYLTVSSENFRIVSHGNVRKITKTITCVVNKEGEVKYYHEE